MVISHFYPEYNLFHLYSSRVIVELGAIPGDIGLEVGNTRKCHYKSNHSSNIEIQTNHSHTNYNQFRADN